MKTNWTGIKKAVGDAKRRYDSARIYADFENKEVFTVYYFDCNSFSRFDGDVVEIMALDRFSADPTMEEVKTALQQTIAKRKIERMVG